MTEDSPLSAQRDGGNGRVRQVDAALTGVGWTEYSRNSGRTVGALAAEAALMAVLDAGLRPEDIDGVVTYAEQDSVDSTTLATLLGVPELRWYSDRVQGGDACCSVVAEAGIAVASGLATHILVFRAMNGRSGTRMGQFGSNATDLQSALTLPYGYFSAAQRYSMACRRHMHEFGTTKAQLAAVALEARRRANANPRAMMHSKPMSMEDYLAARPVAEPFGLFDCCLETDGAVALVVSRSSDASSLRRRPVQILSAAAGAGPQPQFPYEKWQDWTVMFPAWIAKHLYAAAGLDPKDVDFANLYDCFTYTVICQLEDFGFCEKGAGGRFVEDGRIGANGDLPVNPHGGLLSEAYIHGLNNVAEAVLQLRGDAGERQVAGARVGLVTGFGFVKGSALLLAAT
jgi:acetyl-CoA acetyltransferase